MYYVYAYLREDGSPYYIGKGSGKRAFKITNRTVSGPRDKSRIVFWHENLEELDAFELEKFYIRMFGRKDNGTGILRNMTDGGEGSSGCLTVHTDEIKEKIRQRSIELWKDKEFREKQKASTAGQFEKGNVPWNTGLKANTELRQTMSVAQKRRFENSSPHNAVDWKITTPNGDTFIVRGLSKFAKENGLHQAHLSKRGHSKGWKAEKIIGKQ